ncbi:MAG: hypothetical protein JSU69_03140 [Candidatus Zixiibacteriota bacterium]|nr:MAG: hypothetical protein JSU69_03140 [candidate division Zixibacteria bacterium]
MSTDFSRTRNAIILGIILCVLMMPPGAAATMEDFEAGGAIFGVFNAIQQENRDDDDPRRNQFDFAANVDFGWKIQKNIAGFVQFQAGPGEGSLLFAGPEAVITDVNITFNFDDPDASLTVGSFDTPFGEETRVLTNNGTSFGNAFVLNSLFYDAFAGSSVGTLNTLGIMGALSKGTVDLTLALTNGTEATASNPDGNYGIVGLIGFTPSTLDELRIAASFIYSNDRTLSGESGSEAEFTGWMAEGKYEFEKGFYGKGYLNHVIYGDDDSGTRDGVTSWMGEFRYGVEDWHIAARMSGWHPKDNNGDGSGISPFMPIPGFAEPKPEIPPGPGGGTVLTDQSVRRIQIGGGLLVYENVLIKAEVFQDNYQHATNGESTDTEGFIAGLNVRF